MGGTIFRRPITLDGGLRFTDLIAAPVKQDETCGNQRQDHTSTLTQLLHHRIIHKPLQLTIGLIQTTTNLTELLTVLLIDPIVPLTNTTMHTMIIRIILPVTTHLLLHTSINLLVQTIQLALQLTQIRLNQLPTSLRQQHNRQQPHNRRTHSITEATRRNRNAR